MSVVELSQARVDTSTPVLRVRGLAKQYKVGKQMLQAFSDIDFDIQGGQCLALVGESGCGKSSIAMSILRLVEPDQGEVRFEGQELGQLSNAKMQHLRQKYGIVFQNPYSTLNPRMNVLQLVDEPLRTHSRLTKPERRVKVIATLRDVGMDETMLERMPHELSGGQRQRIGIARALILDPRLIVLDEPTAALDVSVQATVINLLKDLREKRGLSYLFITHNLGLVERIADQVLVMYLGRIVESGPVRQVFGQPRHPYTRALIASIPSLDPARRGKLQPLQGEVPSPLNKPSGCAFQGRCQRVQENCRSQLPQLEATRSLDEHRVACHFPVEE